MILQNCINHLVLDDFSTRKSLLNYAIKSNDLAAVKFLIEQEEKYQPSNSNEEGRNEKQKFITLSPSYFDLAMSLGRTEIMGHLIAKIGAEFPFSALMKTAGVEVEKKSQVCNKLPTSP